MVKEEEGMGRKGPMKTGRKCVKGGEVEGRGST